MFLCAQVELCYFEEIAAESSADTIAMHLNQLLPFSGSHLIMQVHDGSSKVFVDHEIGRSCYRRSAVAAMAWRDIDLEAGTWLVPGERAKNGAPIVLPVTGPALTTLRRRWRHQGSTAWVFPGGGKAGHLTSPRKAWSRILERAHLENLRIHDLRRTLGSWLAMSGASLPAIGRVLGHKDPRSTQVYARLQAEAVTATVTVAHRAMSAAVKNPKVVPLRLKKAR